MFSRIYLGMHSFNQVLFGLMLGAYSMLIYYTFVEHWLHGLCLKYLSQGTSNLHNFLHAGIAVVVLCVYQCMITYLNSYTIDPVWITDILLSSKCQKTYNFTYSFYLKCYEDMAIGVVAPMILVALSISTNGVGFIRKLSYSRCSGKFVGYVFLTIISSAIPVLVFLNPWWKLIELPEDNKAALIWAMNILGFSIGILVLVAVSPRFVARMGLAEYAELDSYTAFKQEVRRD